MAKTWGELSQHPDFQSLSREEQETMRGLYFNKYVAPQVAPELLGKARSMYDEKTLNRTWGEALSDTGKQVVEGGINIANAIPSLIAPNSDVVKYLDESATDWRESQSPTMKAKSANAEAAVKKAGEEGFWAQTGEALSQYGTDPALASRLVATNIASLIPGLGSAKAAQVASLARSAKAAEAAGVALNSTEAAARAAKMAMIAGGTTNAALNAGGARGEAYQDIYQTLIDQGYDKGQAEQIALGQSALPAAVGGITGALSGSTGLERALLGPALRSGGLKAFAAGTGKELGTEMVEEGAPKVATNLQAGEYDQRAWSQDLGDTLVQTAIGAGPTSLASGAASAMRATPEAAPRADPAVTPPTDPTVAPEDSTAPDVASTPPEPSFAGLAPEQQQQALQNVAAGKPWDEGLGISDAEVITPAAPTPIPVVGALSAAANAGQQAEAAGISSTPAPTAEAQAAQQQAAVQQQQAQVKQETAAAKDQAALQSAQLKLQQQQQEAAAKQAQQQQAAALQQQAAALKLKQEQLKINQAEQKLGLGPTQFDEPALLNQASNLAALSQPTIDQPTQENADGLQAQTDAQVPRQVPSQASNAANAPAGEVALASTQAPAAATGQTSAPGVAPATGAPLAATQAPAAVTGQTAAAGALAPDGTPLTTTQAPAAASGQTSAPAEAAFPGEAPLATTQAPTGPTGQPSAPGSAPLSNAPAPTEEQVHVDAFNQVNQRINASKKEAAPRALVRLATEADLPAAGRGARRLAGAIASAFGHRVIYIASADAKTPLSFDGSVSPTDPTRILIANDAEAPVTRVVAHEVLHGLKRVAPEVYDNMLGSLRQLYDPQKVARHAKQRGYQGGLNESNEEEWVADFFSNTLHEPKSLAQIALAMDLKKTGAGLEFLNNLKEFIGRIIAKLRGDAVIGQGFSGADEAVKDLEQARAAVVKATAEYARARLTGKTAASMGAAPLSARKAQAKNATQTDEGATDDMDALAEDPEPEVVGTTKPQARKTKPAGNGQWLMSDGTYHGGPEWVNNPAQLGKLRSTLFTLAQEGERGKYWYEKSSKAILAMAGGDPEAGRNNPKDVLDRAEVLVKLLAIYSPNNKVPGNTTAALKAYYQWLAGAEQVHAGLGDLDDKANEMLNQGKEWEGIKTNNFYYNLMVEIDPTRNVKDAATMDMWMALAFDYGSKMVKAIAYPFMHKETILIAKRLTKETGTRWTPHQVQAAVWTAIKARIDAIRGDLARISVEQGWHDPEKVKRNKGKTNALTIANAHRKDYYHKAYELGMAKAFDENDVNIASYDFSNAINERLVQMSIEAVPGASTDVLPGIHKASMAEKLEYQAAIIKAMRDDEGRDRIYKHLGILDLERRLGFSGWEGKGTPGFQDAIATAVVGGQVSDEAKLALNLAADIRGLVLAQEGVAWHYPHYTGKGGSLNGSEIDLGRNLTAEENDAFYAALIDELGHDMAPPIPRVDGRGVRILNFPDEKFALMDDFSDGPDLLGNTGAQRKKALQAAQVKKNKAFFAGVTRAIARQPWKDEVVKKRAFQSDGELRENNWNPGPVEQNPEDPLQDTSRRSNDADYRDRIFESVARRVGNSGTGRSDLPKRLTDELDKTTKFIDGLRKDIHAVNTDFAQRKGWGGPQTFAPLSLRPDAARDERAGAGPAAQGRPSYGTARPGAVKSTGVHYSQAERQTLDSTKYGTGIKGEEGRRVAAAADQRLRQRVYFYVSTGAGVRPEPGVGGYTHTVDLNNLYDLDADPQYLYRPDLATNDERMNAFESAVIDAGFDGYVADFAGQRAAVLLGPHQVPVQYEGLAKRPQVPAGERATPNPIKRVAALLRTPWMRQTPKAFGDKLKAADPDLYRQFGDQLTATDQTYWPGDMVKQLVPPDTVNATPADVVSWSRAAPLSLRTKPDPKKTVKAYKLFRLDLKRPGEIFPLFVKMGENAGVPTGTWQDAEEGAPAAKTGKVASSIGPLAYRPGWHAGDLPIATHIGGERDPGTGKPTVRPDNQVWAEVELGADVDWQAEANSRGKTARDKAITDQIPVDGFYRYKTNANMTGNWLIGGTMRVNRLLSDAEVQQVNDAAGVTDLPRKTPLDLRKFGFAEPHLVFSNRATVQEENLTKREYGAVIRKFTNSDGSRKPGWLKAPNGRPSNLDNRQWVQVRTPSFKKWFGDWEAYAGQPGGVWNDDAGKVSKIVDENGEPQVVYHGSKKAGFTVLDPAEGDKHRSAMVFTAKTNDTAATYAGTKDEAEMPAAPASDAAPTQASLEARGYEFESDEDEGVLWWTAIDPEGNKLETYDNLEEAIAIAAEDYERWGDTYNAVDEKPGIYPLFLNIRNPYESDFGGANWDGRRIYDQFSIWDSENEEYVDGSDYEPLTENEARRKYAELGGDEVEFDGRPRYDIQEAPDLGETTNSVAEDALRNGMDGAIIRQVVDDGGQYYSADPDDVMVFFNANQAKSATQNTGEFSASNDDLRFSLRPQTQTPAFKKWFGKSQITDANGQPKVMYHGTAANIEAFQPRQANAIFLTDNPDFASGFAGAREGANVLPVYVESANPFDYRDPKHLARLEAVLKQNHGTAPIEVTMPRVPTMRLTAADLAKRVSTGNWMFVESAPVMAYIKANHDGFWTKERNQVNLGVFKPTQVKSAVGNVGTFDPANPDIRFSNRPTPPAPPAETRFRKAQRVVQDKFNRFRVIQDWLKEQGVKLSEAGDVYRAEERFHARVANQIEDFREQTLKPLVAKSQKAGVKMADIAQFLHAQHAEERNDAIAKINPKFPDGGSGMATQEARTILKAASPELKQIANEWRKIADDSLELKLQAGLITQEQADAFRSKYAYYVPLRGGPEEQLLVGTGKGLKVRHKEQRALGHPVREGGEWIIEQLLADRESAIMKAEKALIAKHVLQMAVEMQRPDIISVEQPKLRQVLKNQVSYVVTYRGSPIDAFQTLEAARVFRQMAGTQKGNHLVDFDIVRSSDPQVVLMASPRLGDNEMMAYVGGHEIRIQLNDDLLARAYANLGQDALGPILRAGRVLNTWLSKVYTGYNPEFILVNLMRDFTTGIANLSGEQGARMAMRAVKRYPKAFRDLLRYARNPARATQSIKDYREDGGNTGAAYLDDLERIGTDVAAEYAKLQGVIGNLRERNARGAASSAIGQTLKPLISWIEKLNQAGENAMRLAIYQAMRDSGKGRVAAASAAKNTTVNFNRKGELGLALNAWWLFFNASVQGTSAIAHSHFKGAHKGQAWAFSSGLIGTAYLASLLAAGDDEEDDEYEKISEYDRSRNLIIRTQDGFVKLPIPYGYGFFANLGRGLADAQRTGEVGKLPWHLATSFIEEFTPFGAMVAGKQPDWQQAMTFMGPTAWQIGAVPAYNRTSFGTPLYPEQAFKTEEFARDQMWRGTKGTWADELAGALEQAGMDVSPETLKHLWRTGTGGAGTFATGILDAAQLKARGADDLDAREVPLLRKFLAVPGVQEARARYYEAVEEAKIAKETFARFKKQGRFEEMETYQGKNEAMISMAKVAETTAKRIKAARNRYDEVKLDPDLPLPEKRRQLREMEREETQIYDDFVRMFQERTRVAPR